MAKLTIRPSGATIECSDGSNLLEVLRDNKYYVKSSCGGNGSCSDCVIRILMDNPKLPKLNLNEEQMLGNVYHITKERLSCQIEVNGELEIDISAHDSVRDKNSMKSTIKRRTAKEVKTIIDERISKKKERIEEGRDAGFKRAKRGPVDEKIEAKRIQEEERKKENQSRESYQQQDARNSSNYKRDENSSNSEPRRKFRK